MPTFGSTSTSLTLAQLIGASYDDPRWDQLMNQMGKQELWNLVRRSGYLSLGIDSIGMPQVTLKDGSSGISGTLTGGGVACMGYPVEVVLASTYNRALVRQMGEMVGEDSLASGVAVWYAPTMNIHRAATCGRNFEYYSEDGYLSGQMGAAETQGAQSKGCTVTIKHLALNDQETNRYGAVILANEQSIRELYLRGFEASVREGGAKGAMAAMNRVGPRWAGGDAGLMTEVLRGEWGFTGFVTTDQATFPTFNYCDIREGLAAGTDMWLNTGDLMNNDDVETIDAGTWQAVRQAAHRILYVYANSNAMNGISADATLHTGFPTWRWLVLAVTVLMVLFGWVWYKLCCLCFHRRTFWQMWRKKPVRSGLKAL